MSSTIGDLVDRAAKARRWGDQRVAFEIGVLPSEKVFNATQVHRLRAGERQKLSRELIEGLIAALDLDPAEAWEAALESADLKPPGLTVDMLRRLHLVASDGAALTGSGSNAVKPGYVRSLPVERRRRDRRRLYLVPEKTAA